MLKPSPPSGQEPDSWHAAPTSTENGLNKSANSVDRYLKSINSGTYSTPDYDTIRESISISNKHLEETISWTAYRLQTLFFCLRKYRRVQQVTLQEGNI